jgi:hypothetical protein
MNNQTANERRLNGITAAWKWFIVDMMSKLSPSPISITQYHLKSISFRHAQKPTLRTASIPDAKVNLKTSAFQSSTATKAAPQRLLKILRQQQTVCAPE